MPEPRETWRMDVDEVRARIEQSKPFVYESDQLACLGQMLSALDAAQARIAELERERDEANRILASWVMHTDPAKLSLNEYSAHGKAVQESWQRAAERAEAALAAQAWVPCSERMPDPGQLVMVSIAEYSAIDRTLRTCVRLDVRKPTRGWQSESPVVAWRPLPAPWEGDKA